MSNNTTLEINLNEEYKIKIEKGNDFNQSIFQNVYDSALKNVIEIVKQSEVQKGEPYDDYNNLIAFTGERGKGKSSSMISFRDALVNKDRDEHKDFFTNPNYVGLRNKSFTTIDIVDPSLFRGEESLFEIILAKMFQNFQTKIQEKDLKISQDAKRELIQHFQNVFENLQIIHSDRKELFKKESIEALSKLATSSNLRNCFKELIASYLKTFENNKDFLVIAIDDFDLNITGAYEMLEDIRQFLIQKNLILLIACKIEQLSEAIEIYHKHKNLKVEIENKVNKYLEKLFPFKRRLILPDVQKLKNIDLIINNNYGKINTNSSDLSEAFGEIIFINFDLFIPRSGVYHNLYPRTIREIQVFFNLINVNKDFLNFKRYILQEVEKKNIYSTFFEQLDQNDVKYLNLTIIKFIQITFKLGDIRILSQSRIPERVSVGDVLYSISSFEKRLQYDDYEAIKFLQFLKIYYFVRLKTEYEENSKVFKELGRYGLLNTDYKILSDDSGNKSRDFVEFGDNINLFNLSNSEKFIFSQFMQILGAGKSYRNDLEKDSIISNFKTGTFSPFAIFHNMYNFEQLMDAFEFEKNSYIEKNLEWFNDSILIKQLFNPSFAIKFYEDLSRFRTLEIKEELPKNYFDTFILLFIYGSINSIRDKKILRNFIDFPIVRSLIVAFLKRNKISYSLINKVNSELNISIELFKDSDVIDESLINLINEIYDKSNEIKEEKSKDELIRNKLKTLLNRTKNRPQYKIQTLSTIINEIKEIDEFNIVIDELSSFREGVNSVDDEKVVNAKAELQKYLIARLNG
jgi:hypothetical protein